MQILNEIKARFDSRSRRRNDDERHFRMECRMFTLTAVVINLMMFGSNSICVETRETQFIWKCEVVARSLHTRCVAKKITHKKYTFHVTMITNNGQRIYRTLFNRLLLSCRAVEFFTTDTHMNVRTHNLFIFGRRLLRLMVLFVYRFTVSIAGKWLANKRCPRNGQTLHFHRIVNHKNGTQTTSKVECANRFLQLVFMMSDPSTLTAAADRCRALDTTHRLTVFRVLFF